MVNIRSVLKGNAVDQQDVVTHPELKFYFFKAPAEAGPTDQRSGAALSSTYPASCGRAQVVRARMNK